MRIALVTSDAYRHLDYDLDPLVAEGASRGHEVSLEVWTDPDVDWHSFDSCVIRSTWDYISNRAAFLEWAGRVPRLHNPVGVLAANTDKRYLAAMADAGVPVIETFWNVRSADELPEREEWVVKPTISGGSRDTARWSTAADAAMHSSQLLDAGRPTMTQPYISSVDDEGETALLYFGGRFSHAIRKGPMLLRGEGVVQDRDEREEISPRVPSPAQLAVGQSALEAAGSLFGASRPLVYARVDLVTDDSGSPLLIELELTEPSVFLPWSEGVGPTNFLDAVEAAASPAG